MADADENTAPNPPPSHREVPLQPSKEPNWPADDAHADIHGEPGWAADDIHAHESDDGAPAIPESAVFLPMDDPSATGGFSPVGESAQAETVQAPFLTSEAADESPAVFEQSQSQGVFGDSPFEAETFQRRTEVPFEDSDERLADAGREGESPFSATYRDHQAGEHHPEPPASEVGMFGGAPPITNEAANRFETVAAPAPPAKPGPSGQVMMLLFTWASLATILAVWFWMTRPQSPSDLESLPDDGKLQSRTGTMISPVAELSARLTLPLNKTRRFGDLEVTPLSIEYRSVRHVAADGKPLYEPNTLVLRLRLKNLGKAAFHPTDPVFVAVVGKSNKRNGKNRMTDSKTHQVLFENGYTYSYAHPVSNVSVAERILPYDLERDDRIEEQTFPLLQPNQTAETVVVLEEEGLNKLDGPMLWRVKLRKGKTKSGRGVATVIGVPFIREDVKMVAAPAGGGPKLKSEEG